MNIKQTIVKLRPRLIEATVVTVIAVAGIISIANIADKQLARNRPLMSVGSSAVDTCTSDAQIGAMEQYGKVGIVYVTPIFKDSDPNRNWSANFESARNLTIKVELKAYGLTACDAVSALYDKWYEIPFQRVEKVGK